MSEPMEPPEPPYYPPYKTKYTATTVHAAVHWRNRLGFSGSPSRVDDYETTGPPPQNDGTVDYPSSPGNAGPQYENATTQTSDKIARAHEPHHVKDEKNKPVTQAWNPNAQSQGPDEYLQSITPGSSHQGGQLFYHSRPAGNNGPNYGHHGNSGPWTGNQPQYNQDQSHFQQNQQPPYIGQQSGRQQYPQNQQNPQGSYHQYSPPPPQQQTPQGSHHQYPPPPQQQHQYLPSHEPQFQTDQPFQQEPAPYDGSLSNAAYSNPSAQSFHYASTLENGYPPNRHQQPNNHWQGSGEPPGGNRGPLPDMARFETRAERGYSESMGTGPRERLSRSPARRVQTTPRMFVDAGPWDDIVNSSGASNARASRELSQQFSSHESVGSGYSNESYDTNPGSRGW